MGLEMVSCELDDPFGQQPSDLPVLGEMRSVFEDVFLTALDRDGLQAAQALKARVDLREGSFSTCSFKRNVNAKQEALETSRLLA
jgi:hypothetical protein